MPSLNEIGLAVKRLPQWMKDEGGLMDAVWGMKGLSVLQFTREADSWADSKTPACGSSQRVSLWYVDADRQSVLITDYLTMGTNRDGVS